MIALKLCCQHSESRNTDTKINILQLTSFKVGQTHIILEYGGFKFAEWLCATLHLFSAFMRIFPTCIWNWEWNVKLEEWCDYVEAV